MEVIVIESEAFYLIVTNPAFQTNIKNLFNSSNEFSE